MEGFIFNTETVEITNTKSIFHITITHDQSGSGNMISMDSETFFKLKDILGEYTPCNRCKRPIKGIGECDDCHSYNMYSSFMYG